MAGGLTGAANQEAQLGGSCWSDVLWVTFLWIFRIGLTMLKRVCHVEGGLCSAVVCQGWWVSSRSGLMMSLWSCSPNICHTQAMSLLWCRVQVLFLFPSTTVLDWLTGIDVLKRFVHSNLIVIKDWKAFWTCKLLRQGSWGTKQWCVLLRGSVGWYQSWIYQS